MHREHYKGVRLILPRSALLAIFDECDRFEEDETGGRVIGTYEEENDQLVVRVTGVIGPGPAARRSSVSFFQDGEYQERIFRQLEQQDAKVEHLGNWHTHHVNGLTRLSQGDIDTYRRTVNHPNHNTTFFYALLVVAKHKTGHAHERYAVKHYMLRRGDNRIHELTSTKVDVIDSPLIWPVPETPMTRMENTGHQPQDTRLARVYDRDILAEFYPGIRPYSSPRLGIYWRGHLETIDGSSIEVVILENAHSPHVSYSVAVRNPPEELSTATAELADRTFPSARAALIATERLCNRRRYEQLVQIRAGQPKE